MTDPRRLSEAALAAIGEQEAKATPGPWYVNLNDLIGGWSIGTVPGQASENPNYGDIADFLTKENALQIVGLAERLAEVERDAKASADVVDQLVEGTRHWKGIADALTAQLARKRADHAATVAELRSIAEVVASPKVKIYDGDSDDMMLGYLTVRLIRVARAALDATPSHGAAAVLAAADHYETIRAKRFALVSQDSYQTASFREIDKEMTAASNGLSEAVAAWRAARGEQGGG